MIIKSFELQKKINKDINFYLLYGVNSGLIEESIENILKPVFSKNVYNFEELQIIKKSDEFKELIYNKSFFEEEKLLIINRATEKIFPIIDEIINTKIDKVKIIIKANILEKKSKLRNLFEKNKKTIVVAYYEDNYGALLNFIENFLIKEKIRISKESINELINKSMGNRLNLMNELNKIVILGYKNKQINNETISKLTNTSGEYNISELVDQCLAKNKRQTMHILNENSVTEENNLIIIKSFLSKLKRLKKIKTELEKFNNIDTILNSYKPLIFWKEKDLIKKQLSCWSLDQIKSSIQKINNLEWECKKYPQISKGLLHNYIFENIQTINNTI
jgi:DNA polymerase-3 subunit delta